ncbi:MAG: Swt1 family HEPN domain-containing protein [Rhodospirillaceae bacterium]
MKHTSAADQLYSFVYRGHLARQATGQFARDQSKVGTAKRLPFELIEDAHLEVAEEMSVVYMAIAGFERAVRAFIKGRLLDPEVVGENWWEACVPEKRRKKAESRRDEENKIRYHAKRGDSLLDYTEIEDLAAIITTNPQHFEDFIPDIEWAKHIFKSVEHSRNIIMHSGELEPEDVERLAMAMRDWLTQVGG